MGRCCHARALERSLRRSRVFAITSSAVRPCDSYRRAPIRAEGSLTPCRRRRPCDAVCSFATSTLMKSAILPHRSTTPPGNLFEPSSQPPALSRDEPRLRRRRERSPCPCSAARARSLSTAPFARRSAHSHPPRGPPLPPARRLGEGTEGGGIVLRSKYGFEVCAKDCGGEKKRLSFPSRFTYLSQACLGKSSLTKNRISRRLCSEQRAGALLQCYDHRLHQDHCYDRRGGRLRREGGDGALRLGRHALALLRHSDRRL